MCVEQRNNLNPRQESNPRLPQHRASALPTELRELMGNLVPARCSGGYGYDSFRGFIFFLCPTRLTILKKTLTTVSLVACLLLLCWSQVLLNTIWPTSRWRRIGAGSCPFLNSSSACYTAFSPARPVRVTTRYG